jgi:ABC-type polysaccharide/polyol phosphate transport system ATPase subunit
MTSLVADRPPVAVAPAPTSRDDAPAVQLDDITVRYRVPQQRAGTMKEYLVGRSRRSTYIEHEALKSVSLSVPAGEAIGIIGANGSGKTTLLRLIARVLTPSTGRVRTRGRVAPILDVVGALQPELTGRENVFLNGTMLGLSRRDVARRIDRIVEFAEVGPFIDAPLRTYSSGMMARLGFAIASDTDADILVVDEALGVGDERFQRRCAARIDAIRGAGTTFMLVSHDMHSVQRLCSRAVWLDAGRIRAVGASADIVTQFMEAQ